MKRNIRKNTTKKNTTVNPPFVAAPVTTEGVPANTDPRPDIDIQLAHQRSAPPGVVTEKLLITPALAEEFLKKNTGNRTFRETHAERLAREIEQGHWKGALKDEFEDLI